MTESDATIPLRDTSGFWRRFRITPEPGRVCCEVEDDFHCMRVTVCHQGGVATRVEPSMRRVPWTTCPGAEAQLQATFGGAELARFTELGAKKANCTHLYDLALLAASHADDEQPTLIDILVTDPVDDRRHAELRVNGEMVLSWVESGFQLVEPEALAGIQLFDMRAWIASLAPDRQEHARLLQWGNMLANGRTIPLENQSDATKMPPNCYTFQPERAAVARRVWEIRDFSGGEHIPLEDYQAFL